MRIRLKIPTIMQNSRNPAKIGLFSEVCQMRWAAAIARAEAFYRYLTIRQGQNLLAELTFQTLSGWVGDDINDNSVLQKVIYVPVKAFLAPAVSGDPGLQTAESTAGIYVISSREVELAQPPDLYFRVLRQVYQQMIDTRRHGDTA